ncbi:DedA family protein [Mammaliicoccus stepanovicii]|uniref:DedA family protein n=1 Tax=Mammaliicoccus stepanovicii TaxID=643214 RepID=A0A239YG79_9STAP|nr:DedA family protein [Mammaliicoccus stepanovicii]PNZ75794.1 DedA family protein [Mammaliicoccus stepanovicii]GGI40701.1 alkaline phosphatase-like protein [Mammaliicoccus stepanovicii]SNV57712.1 DedA family protein [Mammaliicoccus stepanovicii]
MESWITNIMEQFGYFGIALLILIENVFPPIPSEVILTFGGFMTTKSDLTVFGVVVASTIGSVVGAFILYWIGRILNVERIERIVEKWGKYLRLTKEDVRKADAWFDKYGPWTVFFCRFIPLIRSLISIPAGMSGMNQWVFLSLTTLGTLIWNLVLVLIGAKVGSNWHQIVNYMDIYSNVMYIIIALGVIIFIVWFVKKKK